MRLTIHSFICLGVISIASPAFAWDPWGDITNPGRILENIERETRNAGRAIDRGRLELNAQAGAPALKQWIIASRNDALRAGASPIPHKIRSKLRGFYPDRLLNKVRYRSGSGNFLSLQNPSFNIGGKDAITLDDVIIFRNHNDANNNDVLWAHELAHVDQYDRWGIHDFSIRYLRSWNSVENEANNKEKQYVSSRNTVSPRPRVNAGGGLTISNPTNRVIVFYLETKTTSKTEHRIGPSQTATYRGSPGDRWFNFEVRSKNNQTVAYGLDAGTSHYFQWNNNGILDLYRR